MKLKKNLGSERTIFCLCPWRAWSIFVFIGYLIQQKSVRIRCRKRECKRTLRLHPITNLRYILDWNLNFYVRNFQKIRRLLNSSSFSKKCSIKATFFVWKIIYWICGSFRSRSLLHGDLDYTFFSEIYRYTAWKPSRGHIKNVIKNEMCAIMSIIAPLAGEKKKFD